MGGRQADANRQAWTAAILRVLATVAPEQRTVDHDVSGSGPTAMAWLGSFLPSQTPVGMNADADASVGAGLPDSPELASLQAYDDLTPGSADLAVGWMWVAGSIEREGRRVRLLRPLVSRTISIQRPTSSSRLLAAMSGGVHLRYLTNWDLWPLVANPDRAAELERGVQFGGGALGVDWNQQLVARLHNLKTWANDVLVASGLPPVRTLTAVGDPRHHTGDEPAVYVGSGVYAVGSTDSLRPRDSLGAWSNDGAAATSAFAELYLGPLGPPSAPGAPPPPDPGPLEIHNPLPLTGAQGRALVHARSEPVTVVSGPPGTGKSQTAAAIALDTVARGQSVLVATQSRMAAEVLAGLLDRVPGPTPVLFGGGTRTGALAAKLADGLEAPVDRGAAARSRAAEARADDLRHAIESDLTDVEAAARWAQQVLTLSVHAGVAPRLLDPDAGCATAEARELLDRQRTTTGLFAAWRRRRAERALRAAVGAPAAATVDDLADAVELAELRDRARRAGTADRTRSADRWAAFQQADVDARHALGDAVASQVADAATPEARRAVSALSAALRAGRAVRRAHLLRVDVEALTDALPLWIGTLGDIESLLPARAGAFDLVILDEASMIDQPSASGALLRAKRAVVIGDPRQLRFVSFLADADVQTAITQQRCQAFADRLDLRRVSAFDLAASAAPVQFLDEHFRSVPHLIGFSAHRFYGDRLRVVTRGPSNDGVTAIELRTLSGDRTDGVNLDEVKVAVELAATTLATTGLTVGLISPYRPQVDAIRDALRDAVPSEVIQSGRVRVGSVHGFQGTECDVVIASFGISEGSGRSRRFLEDPHLFNVLVTRAKRQMTVLVSVDDPPAGILADYLRWAATPAPLPPDHGAPDRWTEHLASVLADQGTEVRAGYEIGRWTVDLVIGPPHRAVAVATRVHPAGADHHIARHLALHRIGWNQAEAFPTTRDGDAVATALALADLVTP